MLRIHDYGLYVWIILTALSWIYFIVRCNDFVRNSDSKLFKQGYSYDKLMRVFQE